MDADSVRKVEMNMQIIISTIYCAITMSLENVLVYIRTSTSNDATEGVLRNDVAYLIDLLV